MEELRRLGHDVLTSLEAGNANRVVSDQEVVAFAARENRIVLTHNRLHFVRLHQRLTPDHPGIVVCTVDRDSERLARSVHDTVNGVSDTAGRLFRVTRPAAG